MAWGTITVGGMVLREEINAGEESGGRLRIAGQEAHPPKLRAHVDGVEINLAGMAGLLLPVVFTDKASLTGFYRVEDARCDVIRHAGGIVQWATWQLALSREGTGRDVEIESTVPLIPRAEELAGVQTPVYWHAPAIGYTSYLTGASDPSGFVDRPGSDGVIRVFTGLPVDTPRWTIRADDYLRGAARIYFDTIRRIGRLTVPSAVWEIHNNLVRVTPGAAGSLQVALWDNGDWRSSTRYTLTVAGVAVTSTPELSILRNDPEQVIVRLTYPTTSGRLQVDLALRRGARTVTGRIRRNASAQLRLAVDDPAAFTSSAGLLYRTDADADGNRFVMGSSRNVTFPGGAPGSLTYTGLALDFFLGHTEPAVAGDAPADLLSQYLGSTGETVMVVRR